jgi:hypothetical protein
MKLLAFNGSPRKKWNTATFLRHVMEGAESGGAKTWTTAAAPAVLPASGLAGRTTGTAR